MSLRGGWRGLEIRRERSVSLLDEVRGDLGRSRSLFEGFKNEGQTTTLRFPIPNIVLAKKHTSQ